MQELPLDPPGAGDHPTPGMQVHTGFVELLRWAGRAEIRRRLYGSADEELSPNEATLLEYVSRHGPVRISELAAEQGVDKSTMTPQVRRLEDKGLIGRQPDPADGRAALLATSEKGSGLQDQIGAAGAALFDEILSGWSAEDRETLGSMFLRFAGQLRQHEHHEQEHD